jgi:xylose isomerase
MVGLNPELAHEHMAGLNFTHGVAMALWMNKLYHIDLNDQAVGRYDQDFRFGSENPKAAFFLVKLLEDHGYSGYKHFDSHAYRSSDRADVIEFARGSMRTYLRMREAAKRWNSDARIKEILAKMPNAAGGAPATYSSGAASDLLATSFDRESMASRSLPYEALDQRTIEILMGG